jgi:hypothetical protein
MHMTFVNYLESEDYIGINFFLLLCIFLIYHKCILHECCIRCVIKKLRFDTVFAWNITVGVNGMVGHISAIVSLTIRLNGKV